MTTFLPIGIHDKTGLETREEQEPQTLGETLTWKYVSKLRWNWLSKKSIEEKERIWENLSNCNVKKQYYKEKNCAQLFQKSLLLLACEPE